MTTDLVAGLAESPWPRFRGNAAASGRSAFPGPDRNETFWRAELGPFTGEPAVGPNGTIYLPLASGELVAINPTGQELWRVSLPRTGSGKVRTGITTPAVRGDGTIIVATTGSVACLSPDGGIVWEKFIDGTPSAPNIGRQGTIYVSAWSLDWIGFYLISPDGEATGQDDPRLADDWRPGPGSQVTPVALDDRGHVAVAYRDYGKYRWDPDDPEDFEEFHNYPLIVFDEEGHRIGSYVSDEGWWEPSALSVGENGRFYHVGRGRMMVSDPREENPLSYDTPNAPVFSNGLGTVGYPTYGSNGIIWVRLALIGSGSKQSPMVLGLAGDAGQRGGVLRLSGPVAADPVIDRDGRIYVGTLGGAVHVFDPAGIEQKVVDVGSPVSALAIGPDASLVVVCEDDYVYLVI